MRNDDLHLTDAALVQIIDREASALETPRIEAHLVVCRQCRARRAELELAISAYLHVHDWTGSVSPPMDEERALLLSRLVQLAAVKPAAAVPTRRFGRFAYGGVTVCLILAAGVVMYFSVQKARAASIPDERLTPGVTRSVTTEDICSSGPLQGFYPIPVGVAVSVFENYRILNPQPRSYEVDYLITPALGGADDIRNLWPQPYASGEWNSHVKDALEDHLHDLVCAGQLDLATAQHDLASNWIAAYQKYFHTNRPLPDHVAFAADPAWEN